MSKFSLFYQIVTKNLQKLIFCLRYNFLTMRIKEFFENEIKNAVLKAVENNEILDNNSNNTLDESWDRNIYEFNEFTFVGQNSSKNFDVIFRYNNGAPISVNCQRDEKVSDLIERYRAQTSNYETDLKFIFNYEKLNQSLTVEKAGLKKKSTIYVFNNPK